MTDPDPHVRDVLERALAGSAEHMHTGTLLIAGVGLFVVVGSLIRAILWLAAIGLVGFGGLVVLMIWSKRRARDNPLRVVVLDRPEQITTIGYRRASVSSSGAMNHWLVFGDGQRSLVVRLDESVIHALAPLLARSFVNARIEIPGFTPVRSESSSPPP